MPNDENTKYQIKVILGILGITGVLVLVGSVVSHLNQITSQFSIQ